MALVRAVLESRSTLVASGLQLLTRKSLANRDPGNEAERACHQEWDPKG